MDYIHLGFEMIPKLQNARVGSISLPSTIIDFERKIGYFVNRAKDLLRRKLGICRVSRKASDMKKSVSQSSRSSVL
jgi:hypothetical protein